MNNQRGPRSLGVAGTSTSKAEDRGGAALSPRAGASSRREDESPVQQLEKVQLAAGST